MAKKSDKMNSRAADRERDLGHKCTRCVYRSGTPEDNGCDFLYLTSQIRGCPPDENCIRFKEGPRLKLKQVEPRSDDVDPEEKRVRLYEADKRRKFYGIREAIRKNAENKK